MSNDSKRKDDVIDLELSRQLAWRTIPLPEKPKEPEEKPPTKTIDPEEAEQRAEFDRERCQELADDVRAAWAMTSPARQVAATKILLRRAVRLHFGIFGMQDHPVEAIRLLRLAARHAQHLRISQISSFQLAFMPLPSRHPEMADLIVDVARCGNRRLIYVLDRAMDRSTWEGKHPSLGARLAEIVDTVRNRKIRATALRWLSLDDFQDAIPTLRRALRFRHARMRYYALFILVQMKGSPLREEDLQWLLDDAVIHPLDRGDTMAGYERIHDYEQALIEAIRLSPPRDGARPLEVIADGDGEHIFKERPGLDSGWALEALAAGYPDRALVRIDRNLISPDAIAIYDIVAAIGRLPEELAKPRLLVAAGHSNDMIVERAKKTWFERFGSECPAGPLAGVPVQLLNEAPSERMMACLTVLRGASKEARMAMIDVLLQDAPEQESPPETLDSVQREALALLLFTLRTRGNIYDHPTLGKLSMKDWAKLLVRRFGAPAFDVMAEFATEGVRVGVQFGWLSALADVARDKLLDETQIERLREIARIALDTPHPESESAAAALLQQVGAPRDLGERLLDIVTGKRHARKPTDCFAAQMAAGALAEMADHEELDERITQALEAAWHARQWEICDRLMSLACTKRIPAAMDVAMRVVDSYDGDVAGDGAVYRAFDALVRAGRIDDHRVLSILERPDDPLFATAASSASYKRDARVEGPLIRALESPAGNGAAAARAAQALYRMGAISSDDERLERILAAAPEYERAELCDVLLFANVPLERIQQHIESCLLSSEERVSYFMADSLWLRRPDGIDELFEAILPKVTVAETRALIQHDLRVPNEAASYWRDEDEEEEWDDEDDFDDDEDESDDVIPEGDG